MDYSPEQLLDIWKKGISLNSAIWIFTDEKLQTAYKNAHSEVNYGNNKKEYPTGLLKQLENLSLEVARINQHSRQQKVTNNNLWNNLYQKIISGKLIAVGYRFPVEVDFPTLIPIHMWPPENIDVTNSSVSAHEIKFVRVKVIKKSSLSKITDKKEKLSKNIIITDKKIGRPSLKEEIRNAYKYLKKHKQIDYSKYLKSHTDIIQKTVRELYPNVTSNTGMEHEAIRRSIGNLFQSDKKKL